MRTHPYYSCLNSQRFVHQMHLVKGSHSLINVLKKRSWSDKYTVTQSPLSTWHLLHKKEPNDLASEDSEVVVHVQGILHQYDLPPFNDEISWALTMHSYTNEWYWRISFCFSAASKQWKYLRQAVGLTGLGNTDFEASIKGLIDVHAMFNRFVPMGKLQANTIIDQNGEHASIINCSNRYFSSWKDQPYSKHLPFSADIDPKGILTRAVGGLYFHAEDNVVWYYERREGSNGAVQYVYWEPSLYWKWRLLIEISRYSPIPPVLFREGDVVEAQISMMLVPLKGGQFKMTAVLRCLTLLDSTYSRVSKGYKQSDPSKAKHTYRSHSYKVWQRLRSYHLSRTLFV